MLIGIDASRGFLKNRTGVEEYSYQITKALAQIDRKNQYILYLNGAKNLEVARQISWPENCKLKNIPLPRLWVHLRLCRAAWRDKVDVLFIPAQAMPIFYPRKTVVTLHGLEYEHYPKSYSFMRRFYLRLTTKFSLKHARAIIAVSENTKKDLIKMYGGNTKKIRVIYHGLSKPPSSSSFPSGPLRRSVSEASRGSVRTSPNPSLERRGNPLPLSKGEMEGVLSSFLLSLGRLETRKNIVNLIKAFELLKKDGWGGQLVLAGKPGYGYSEIKKAIEISPFKKDIIEKGFVDETLKWWLLARASVFVFPSFYEGFGLPLLEAFAARIPVVSSSASSLPEVGYDACLYFDPNNINDISVKIKQVLDDQNLQQDLTRKGQARLQKFSWEKCARETLAILSHYKRMPRV